jgi:hypothetical protein
MIIMQFANPLGFVGKKPKLEQRAQEEETLMNILKVADEIINNRSEEKERQYGPIGEGLERAASIASNMTGKYFTADDMFAMLIALKFSRHSYNYKEDNFLDAAAYLGAWNNYCLAKGDSQ